MGAQTEIQWCDATFNPWRGCTKIAAGCEHCYAATMAQRNPRVLGQWGPMGTRVVAGESMWREPLKWNREAKRAGVRARVFCASLADVCEDWCGAMTDHQGRQLWLAPDWGWTATPTRRTLDMRHVRSRLFALIDSTPNLDWLLLTKRPEHIRAMWSANMTPLGPGEHRRPNVWLGTSISTQADAHNNIPALLACRDLAPVLFLSAEPLLERVDVRWWVGPLREGYGIHWIIAGGESGPHARPMHPDWARTLRDQCQAAGVPFLFKQWGEWTPAGEAFPEWAVISGDGTKHALLQRDGQSGTSGTGATPIARVGKQAAGRLLDGREWNEFPRTEVAHVARG